METLQLFPFLSEIKSHLDELYHSIISAKSITLIAQPKLDQIISLSLIESSLIDHGMMYKRIIVDDLDDFEPNNKDFSIYFSEKSSAIDSGIFIESKEISVKMGQNSTLRNGRIDVVSISGCLALMIGGKRINQLIPFFLAGNWLQPNLDYTYDPIYTSFRDALGNNGIISVVTIVEIQDLDIIELPGINTIKLNELKNEWKNIDLFEQSKKLSELVFPLLNSSLGVARLEELIWHRIVKPGWDSDLASQCSRVQRELRSSSKKLIFASRLVDNIIKTGQLY